MLALLVGCGPWIIEPEPAPSSAAPTVAEFADARAVLARRFELDDRAFVATDDGLVFVHDTGEELQLLLSRAGNTDEIEVLARVERFDTPPGTSHARSHPVACSAARIGVRYYLFGQDTRELTRTMTGLDALGGEVVDGLWVIAILDDEIAPDQPWAIRDGLGIATMESGTGSLFLAEREATDTDHTLCEALH